MLKKSLLTVCALLVIVFALICPASADWAMFRADLNRTGAAEDWSPGAVTWDFSTGGPIKASPAISDGVVYITSYDDYVYALDGVTELRFGATKLVATSTLHQLS